MSSRFGPPGLTYALSVMHDQPRTQPAYRYQGFSFGCESRFSRDIPQSGKISAMECATTAGLRRRLSRRENIIARRNPVRAPRDASVSERLLIVRRPWPVSMNPVYAIVTVQRAVRTENMGIPLDEHNIATIRPCRVRLSDVFRKMRNFTLRLPACLILTCGLLAHRVISQSSNCAAPCFVSLRDRWLTSSS